MEEPDFMLREHNRIVSSRWQSVVNHTMTNVPLSGKTFLGNEVSAHLIANVGRE